MAGSVRDDWVRETFGIDVAARQLAPTAAGAPNAGNGPAAMPGGDGGGSGAAPEKTKATASFAMVSRSHPSAGPGEDGPGKDGAHSSGAHSGSAPGGAPGGAAGGAPGGGDPKAEAIGKTIDKVVEIGEKVVVAIAKHSKISNSDKTLSILPQGAKGNQVRDGALGNAKFAFGLVGGFGNSLADMTIEIDYMLCTVFGNKGRFLKDIRLVVNGSVFPGLVVDVKAAFGAAGSTGPSPEEWIVDLVVDINVHWNSVYIFDGQETHTVRLNAASGARLV